MTRTLLISIVITLIIASSGPAADKQFKWGKVPKEILELKAYAADTSVAAVVLFDIGEMEFDKSYFTMTFKRHKRIKIFKADGKDYADIRIPYWHEDHIREIKAHAILPNGKKIKLKKKHIFEEGSKKGWRYKVFSIPGVQNNCVIEVRYRLSTEYIAVLEPWEFQSAIPTEISRLHITIPNGFKYNSYLKNSQNTSYKPKREDVLTMDFGKSGRYTWEFTDLPPIKEEPFMTTLRDYTLSLNFQLISYRDPYYWFVFVKTWNDIKDNFINYYRYYLNDNKKVRNLAVERMIQESNPLERAKLLYYFVRDNIETTEYKGLRSKIRDPGDVIKTLRGSAVEKNLLLVSLLRNAGFDANPFLISTRNHGRMDTRNPRVDSFNHLITYVKISNSDKFLDTIDTFCPFEILPPKDISNTGLIISEDEATLLNIPAPNTVSMSYSIISDAEIDADGTLTATVSLRFESYRNMRFRRKLADGDDKKSFTEYFVNKIADVIIEKFDVGEGETVENPLRVNITIKAENFATVGGDRMYIPTAFIHKLSENPFKLEKRTFPVEFNYPRIDQENVDLKLPEGYAVEQLPNTYKIRKQGIQFDRIVTVNEGSLKYARRLYIKNLKFFPSEYTQLRELYSTIVKADEDIMVLKRFE